VYLGSAANKNTIGGDATGEGNVMSGNGDSGVYLESADGNTVSGNYIGTNTTGTKGLGNGSQGILIMGGSQSNTIGGDTVAERNVISGNAYTGIWMQGDGTDGNIVMGNYVGITPDGTGDLGNSSSGIQVSHGASSNTVGGNTETKRNVISGNQEDGVRLEGSTTILNKVQGNYIGTDAAGTSALRNDQYGVRLMSGAHGNTVGGSSSGTRNIISGNYWGGVIIRDAGTDGNIVAGNYIGTDPTGSLEVSSSLVTGVQIASGAQGNTIGGSTDGTGNLISGNDTGVLITGFGTDGNLVAGNYVGLSASGNVALPNHSDGVRVAGSAHDNIIGGTTAVERNVISGNEGDGVEITGASTVGNTVLGNYIGLNWNGTGAVGNDFSGVYVYAPSNTIGGDTASERNVISGNGWFGVELETSDANGNVIAANHIGTNVTGMVALGNAGGGVGVHGGAYDNTIGGNTSGERNVISGNGGPGVWISGGTLNAVLGNYIGLKAAGDVALGNDVGGVLVDGGALDTFIGSLNPGEGNVISGNSGDGVVISGTGTQSISVVGNTIGLEATGDARVGNLGSGVVLTDSALLNLVQANFVSGNEANGLVLAGSAHDNQIATNHIGLDSTGLLSRHNALDGVLIADGATSNLVGGDELHEVNTISANHGNGVQITGASTTLNTVSGNWIGIDNAGNDEGNGGAGVKIAGGAWNNTVGGTAAGERNIISGNGSGVWIMGPGTHSNTVAGNYVGLALDGDTAVGNDSYGVALSDDAQNNVIGGTAEGARNVISGNGDGLAFWGSETMGNSVLGNYIGTDATGSLERGNGSSGILMIGGHHNTIGGSGAGAGNLISGNQLGLFLSGSGVHHYTIVGNYVGTDATGAAAVPNQYGIYLLSGAHDNTIGGSSSADGNLISGNQYDGIQILSSSTVSNTVSANHIGTDASGTSALPNGRYGVIIASAAKHNLVGGDAAGEGNLVSGNGETGVQIQDTGTMSNTVSGNLIGTDVSGTLPLGNSGHGVGLYSGVQYNVVGGDTEAERNVIADNGWSGVALVGSGTDHNLVLGNYVGTDAAGSTGLGNGQDGVLIQSGAEQNTIGGDSSGERNVISGNDGDGVQVSGSETAGNAISGNYIGLGADGDLVLGNAANGIYLWGTGGGNIVGGDTAGERNVISGNYMGVKISEGGQSTVSGNYVGTDADGRLARPNQWHGVHIVLGAQGNTIGGTTAGERNVISGNTRHGVRVESSDTEGNVISGNYVGTTANGAGALANGWNGVSIADGAKLTLVGGYTPGSRNLISGNNAEGVAISGSGTISNTVAGNWIGTDANGMSALANGGDGVHIAAGAQHNQIGPGNRVAFNSANGVQVSGAVGSTLYNTITENSIHGNTLLGIENTLGGNTELPPPAITLATPTFVEGTAPANSRVELFTGPDEEGKTYLTFTMADGSGNWSVALAFVSEGFVTATATDGDGNTSEFSEPVEVEAPSHYHIFLPVVVRNY
jgi:parallel beta-helix repeat protein